MGRKRQVAIACMAAMTPPISKWPDGGSTRSDWLAAVVNSRGGSGNFRCLC